MCGRWYSASKKRFHCPRWSFVRCLERRPAGKELDTQTLRMMMEALQYLLLEGQEGVDVVERKDDEESKEVKEWWLRKWIKYYRVNFAK